MSVKSATARKIQHVSLESKGNYQAMIMKIRDLIHIVTVR